MTDISVWPISAFDPELSFGTMTRIIAPNWQIKSSAESMLLARLLAAIKSMCIASRVGGKKSIHLCIANFFFTILKSIFLMPESIYLLHLSLCGGRRKLPLLLL